MGDGRHVFMQDKPAAQDAGQREKSHIDADEPGEIPSHQINEQAVACERGAAAENPRQTAAAQTAPHDRIAGHFQTGGESKDQTGKDIHHARAWCAPILGMRTKNAR